MSDTKTTSGYSALNLLPHHAHMLADSAIAPEVAKARGYWSATKKAELKRLGFSDAQCCVPALVIPIFNAQGEVVLHQIRPDTPRANRRGRQVKYETPTRALMTVDIPPAARAQIRNPKRPLFITEGIKKGDSAVSHGLTCVALIGVWSWRGRNDDDSLTALAAWDEIHLKEREVYIVFDSDVMQQDNVYKALKRLKTFLESRHANVKVIYLESRTDGGKVGLDDFFASGGVMQTLLANATDKLRDVAKEERLYPYEETEKGLIWHKPTRDGTITTELSNFTARILHDMIQDDGIELRRACEIEVTQGGRSASITIGAEKFAGMGWVAEALGSSAILAPGPNIREHTRTAVQCLSLPIAEKYVYTHLGWRKIHEKWVYLHAGGAISETGIEADIEVSLPTALERHALPAPLPLDEQRKAVSASLQLLRVASLTVTAPLYCAIFRAVCGDTDFSLHLTGPTGTGKTELAALMQQHHGADVDARHLPASWSSTGNSLEGLAFAAKDSLIVIDDFAPTGSAADIQRYHREADRILRAQGNAAGRMRMKADATLRPSKPPRGLILSTGEDIPRGHSLRARTLTLEVTPSDIDWQKMTTCQNYAAQELYAQALSGFITWSASRYEELKAKIKHDTHELRLKFTSEHKRTSDIIASLAAGFDVFLMFATEIAAISAEEAKKLRKEVWNALASASAAQAQHQSDREPARRFIELLIAAISSGRAHLANPNGGEPADPAAWGWEASYHGNGENTELRAKAKGEKIGWLDGDNLYLDSEVAFAVAQRLSRDQNDSVPVTLQTLRKRLKEKNYLASVDDAHETITVRRVVEGKKRPVLHVRKNIFLEGLYTHKKPDIPDTDPDDSPKAASDPENTEEKPDTETPEPDIPDTDPTRENNDKSDTYDENVGNVGFSVRVDPLAREKKVEGVFEAKNGVGNVGFSEKQNPTSASENPTSGEFHDDSREDSDIDFEESER